MGNIDLQCAQKFSEYLWMSITPNEFIELRLVDPFKKSKPLHGAFNSPESMIKVLNIYSGKRNIYFGLNPRRMSSLKRGEDLNRLFEGSAYQGSDVSRVTHFLIDFDRREKVKDQNGYDVPANQDELDEIYLIVNSVSKILLGKGVSHEVYLSGNGYHILINTVDYDPSVSAPMFKVILNNLDKLHGTERVAIDKGTFDVPRICKFYGSLAIKKGTAENRSCKVSTYISGKMEPVDVLHKLENLLLESSSETYPENIERTEHLPIVEYFKKHDLYVKALGGGKHIVNCPFEENHGSDTNGTSTTAIFDGSSGHFGFKCFHTECVSKTVVDALKTLGEWQQRNYPKIESGGFEFRSWRELVQFDEEEIDWLVNGILLRGGLSIMGGRPKSGKTTLARDLAYCVSHGEKWLDKDTKKGVVLFVALEDHLSQLRRIFGAMNLQSDAPIFFHVGRAPVNAIKDLKESIVKNNASLVVIDTMLKFNPIEDVSSYGPMNEFLTELMNLCRETNCHIMVLHHTGKGGEERAGDDERSLLGSTAIAGGADTLIFVTRGRDGTRCVHTQQRYGQDLPKQVLIVDEETGRIHVQAVGSFRITTSREKILDLLKNGPKERSFLEKELEIKKQSFSDCLKQMTMDGLVVQEKEGRKHLYRSVVAIDSSPNGPGGGE